MFENSVVFDLSSMGINEVPEVKTVVKPTLFKVMDYSKINIPESYRPCNESVLLDTKVRVAECFRKSNFTVKPVKVRKIAKDKYELLDNREVFEACKEQNFPVYVYVDNDSTLMENVVAGDLANKWKQKDHLLSQKNEESVKNLLTLLNTRYTKDPNEKQIGPSTLAFLYNDVFKMYEGKTISGAQIVVGKDKKEVKWSDPKTFPKEKMLYGMQLLSFIGKLYDYLDENERCSWNIFVKELTKLFRGFNKKDVNTLDKDRLEKAFKKYGKEIYTKGDRRNILWNVAYAYNKGYRANNKPFMYYNPHGSKNQITFKKGVNEHTFTKTGDIYE